MLEKLKSIFRKLWSTEKITGKCPDCGSKERKLDRRPVHGAGYNDAGEEKERSHVYDVTIICSDCGRLIFKERKAYRHLQTWSVKFTTS